MVGPGGLTAAVTAGVKTSRQQAPAFALWGRLDSMQSACFKLAFFVSSLASLAWHGWPGQARQVFGQPGLPPNGPHI